MALGLYGWAIRFPIVAGGSLWQGANLPQAFFLVYRGKVGGSE